MDEPPGVAALLHEAADPHHRVFRITGGADDDWASWDAPWLLRLSELAELLAARVVRSELISLLVGLDRQDRDRRPAERWEDDDARELVRHFGPSRHPTLACHTAPRRCLASGRLCARATGHLVRCHPLVALAWHRQAPQMPDH